MGSIVMNGARIGRGSVVGAGSVITEGKQFPEYSLIIGSPARVIRTLDPAQVAKMGSAAQILRRQRAAIQKRHEEDRLRQNRLKLAGRLKLLPTDRLPFRRPLFHGRWPRALLVRIGLCRNVLSRGRFRADRVAG